MTSVKPGSPASVDLTYRNISNCNVKVYRIDLAKFSLLSGDSDAITQINLAGIRPLHDVTVPLGDGKDYRDRIHKLAVPITKEGRLPGGVPRRRLGMPADWF